MHIRIVQHMTCRDDDFVAAGATQRKRANEMKLGILGTGHVARPLAAAWQKAGHDIILGSRDPGSKQVEFPVKTLVEAASGANIIINAIIGSAALETISSIDADAFAGKTVINVSNAVTPTFDLVYPNASLAEKLQEALPNAHLVKSMNTAAMTLITNPTRIGPSSVFLSGNSAQAKAETAGLLRDLGWTDNAIVDLGGIESARGAEAYIVLFATLAGALKTDAFNMSVGRSEG
jgi:8-hydroxy-5-deazaflavin:NADPH oxidoreductase